MGHGMVNFVLLGVGSIVLAAVLLVWKVVVNPQMQNKHGRVMNSPSRGKSIITTPQYGRCTIEGADIISPDMAELIISSVDYGVKRVRIAEHQIRPLISNLQNLCGHQPPEYILTTVQHETKTKAVVQELKEKTDQVNLLRAEKKELELNVDHKVKKIIDKYQELEEARKPSYTNK